MSEANPLTVHNRERNFSLIGKGELGVSDDLELQASGLLQTPLCCVTPIICLTEASPYARFW